MMRTEQEVSMGIAGMAVSVYVGNSSRGPEGYRQFIQRMKLTFITFMPLCIIGVYASSARNRKPAKN